MILLFSFHLQEGITPFMWACASPIDRSAKVRYLDEKGADCRAKDHVRCCLFATNLVNKSPSKFIQRGKTALFYATFSSKCDDDKLKDLRYLVIEKGIDINAVDEVAVLPYFEFSFSNSSFRWDGHPYCTHIMTLFLSSPFSN